MARIACLFSIEYYDTVEYPLDRWDKIPFGLSIIAACLERAGHEVRCWVVCPDSALDQVAHEIVHDFGCDMVAASSVTTQFPLIARLCGEVKALEPSTPVLLGGVHSTIRPQECIAHPAIDAVCIGEGEDAAVSWVNALAAGTQPKGIPGTWIKIPGRTEIDRTPTAPFRDDLDRLPLMNYGHWERWINPKDRSFRVVVGRGCPYACTYCSNHALRRVQSGRYVRFRSPENILAEIETILRRFPETTSIYLEIETIGASISWALQLANALAAFNEARGRPIAFRANLAVTGSLFQQEENVVALLTAFRRANLLILNVGLESGSQRVRREILNRPPYTNDELIKFCAIARQQGIAVTLYILIGVPTETSAEAIETSAVARACDPLDISPSIFYPYPGTKLHERSAEMRLIDARDIGSTAERSRVYLKSKDFPRWRVFLEYVLIQWRVFHGRRKTIKIVRTSLSRALAMAPGLLIAALHAKENLRVHLRPHSPPAPPAA
ncbi:MAG TPA: radical SAM protein [Terracidiphilus sp.]|nr:radical SAM protein [Terracidiphilus sp.]